MAANGRGIALSLGRKQSVWTGGSNDVVGRRYQIYDFPQAVTIA